MNNNLSIFLKKLRLNSGDEKLKDMAKKLNISIALLSSIETGKRKMNNQVLLKIITEYALDTKATEELKYLKDMATDEISVKTEKMDDDKKSTLINFLSKVECMNQKELTKINLILKKQKGDKK